MRTEKSRVFIAARKRGIDVSEVRALLRCYGAPPTLSECPEVRIQGFHYSFGADGNYRAVPVTHRSLGDYREISRELADRLIRVVSTPMG